MAAIERFLAQAFTLSLLRFYTISDLFSSIKADTFFNNLEGLETVLSQFLLRGLGFRLLQHIVRTLPVPTRPGLVVVLEVEALRRLRDVLGAKGSLDCLDPVFSWI